ncbi:MAG: M48 family metallopeptidase [Hyphomicrobiaceae bacterium]
MSTSSNTSSFASFTGRYSDGQSAKAHDVKVSFGLRGLEISPMYTESVVSGDMSLNSLVWPYDTLITATPLGSYDSDVSLTSTQSPGATLFVPSQAFCSTLCERAPHLKSGAQLWQQLKPIFLATGTIAAIVGLIYASGISIAGGIASALPYDVRQAMGRGVMVSMVEEYETCETPDGTAALNRLKQKLRKADGSKTDYNIYVLNWQIDNAFATPGENIVLARGILDHAQSADELAGVLAHEMGHSISRHPETGIVRSVGLAAAVQLMFGGSYSTVTSAASALAQLSYSRDAEREADDHALRILDNANISRKGLISFFQRMHFADPTKTKGSDKKDAGQAEKKKSSEDNRSAKAFEFFSTHPATKARIQKMESDGDYNDQGTKPAMSDADWQAIRSICKNFPKAENKKPENKKKDD